MPSWVALLGRERSDEETRALRAGVVREYATDRTIDADALVFTCDDCPAKNTCDFAFDLYNTDGDCLAEK